ncbi:hypothetical protein ACUPZ6_001213 [Campylobacter coli]
MINIENFKPLQDFVLIKTEPVKLETESGIITKIQKSNLYDRPTKGVVIKQGPKCKYNLINKTVQWDITKGQDVEKNYILLAEDSILGIIE